MRTDQLLLGIDFGTGGCKVTVIDPRGRVVAWASGEYPTHHPHPGWAEQDPADWYSTLGDCLKQLWSAGGVSPAKIVAVALDGSTHNAVLLDGHLKPLRRTIMWTDQRSVQEAGWLEEHHGPMIFKLGYQRPTPTWTLPQLLWLKNHEPAVWSQIQHILFVKDYVRYLMTGELCTDYIEAQGSLLLDMARNCWSPSLCELLSLPVRVMPRLVKPTDLVGQITDVVAAETGLLAGTPVICGSSDSAVEDFAAGAIHSGQAVVKLATAGNFNVMTAEPHPSAQTLTYSHIVPGMWYTVTATNAAAICQRWFRDNFCAVEQQVAAQRSISPYQLMSEQAAKSTIGSHGLFFHPYLQGERSPYWDASLRGSFVGFSMAHTKADFIRSVMEGVAFSLRDCRRVLDQMNLPIHEIRLIGGGAKDPLWSQIVCDVLGVPVKLPAHGDASSGAALLAGVGVGLFADERAAVQQGVHLSDERHPQPQASETYTRLFDQYRHIHDALAEVYHRGSSSQEYTARG